MNFKYTKCYKENGKKCVTSLKFDVSRYGAVTHTLEFVEPVTKTVALEAIERYLSEPVDEDHFARVRNDLFDVTRYNNQNLSKYTRGDLLTDARFAEHFRCIGGNGEYELECGS